MNLVEMYVRKTHPEILARKELDKQVQRMAKRMMLMAYGMMIFYMAMATYNMFLVVELHKYEAILNIISNGVLFWLMIFCLKKLEKVRK